MSSPICYVEIPAPNPEKAGTFYHQVFGWNVTPSKLTDQNYWMFSTGDGQLSGGFSQELPVNTGGALLYVRVKDIKAKLDEIKAAGGSVFFDKEDIGGDYGFSAQFLDPSGNRMGLYTPPPA